MKIVSTFAKEDQLLFRVSNRAFILLQHNLNTPQKSPYTGVIPIEKQSDKFMETVRKYQVNIILILW